MKKNILVVGAGFAGATIARALADSGCYTVHVIDQRNHIAGNAYDPVDEELNLRVHQYGPHIFHTNDQRIFDFLSRFTQWIPYEHKVEAWVDKVGYVPIPINRTTLNTIYQCQLKNEEEVKNFLDSLKCHHQKPSNAQEMAENFYGIELTQLFFGVYTKKMWAMELNELPAEVLARLPIRYDDNHNYFNDKIQAMPAQGYLNLFENLLEHPDISVSLSLPFEKCMENDYYHVFSSMPIDVYFDEKYGALPYRSIQFVHQRVGQHQQPVPTVNFTDNSIYTRQTDWRLYPGCDLGERHEILLTREIPCCYEENHFERYYPVKTVEGTPQKIYQQYRSEAEKLRHITFIGRCGQYIYYDMHQVVANSLKIAKDFLSASHDLI
jgi:UDP-galactopyranose mutase